MISELCKSLLNVLEITVLLRIVLISVCFVRQEVEFEKLEKTTDAEATEKSRSLIEGFQAQIESLK